MRVHSKLIPAAALSLALSGLAMPVQAQDRGRRDGGPARGDAHERARGDRDGDGGGRAVPRERAGQPPRPDVQLDRRDDRRDRRDDRRDDRWDRRDDRRDRRDDRWDRRDDRWDRRNDRWNRRDNYRYAPPRVIVPGPRVFVPRRVPRHYYGPGGNYSVYFGLGNGYRFGSWYTGRVYGYVAPGGYGVRRFYGDVRLQVRPRHAEVYVDGYYAGIVDNFDGVFQRLTIEVGEHEIEIAAPGFEPQFYRIYVDPTRTVDVHGDLYPVGYGGAPGGYPGNYPPPY